MKKVSELPCPSCKKPLSPKATSCPNCGQPLEEGWGDVGKARKKMSGAMKIGIILLGIIVVLSLGLVALVNIYVVMSLNTYQQTMG